MITSVITECFNCNFCSDDDCLKQSVEMVASYFPELKLLTVKLYLHSVLEVARDLVIMYCVLQHLLSYCSSLSCTIDSRLHVRTNLLRTIKLQLLAMMVMSIDNFDSQNIANNYVKSLLSKAARSATN